jgi:hypothetical protein
MEKPQNPKKLEPEQKIKETTKGKIKWIRKGKKLDKKIKTN